MTIEEFASNAAPNLVDNRNHIKEAVTGGKGIYHLARWSDHEKFMELFDGSLFQGHEISYIKRYSRSLRA